MFDHGGVLDGGFVQYKKDINYDKDLVLQSYDEDLGGGFQVLKNGIEILTVRANSYEFPFVF